jgi:tRNA (guanine37-N1)-methyltransferase
MQVDVFTLIPESMKAYLDASILGKAQDAGLISVALHNIRDYATDKHHTTDDEPYGGGGGMVMKPEPLFASVQAVLGDAITAVPVILLTPQGRLLTHSIARQLASLPRLALICGRYEGIDERVRQHLATDEISIGDYVLTGGELPALVLIDAVARQITGVLGDAGATERDSHAASLLEHPHYTRPAEFQGWEVPEVLLSGDHARIAKWRRERSLLRTLRRRPDMLQDADLTDEEQNLLEEASREIRKHKASR